MQTYVFAKIHVCGTVLGISQRYWLLKLMTSSTGLIATLVCLSCRENQGPSALIGTTTVSNPLAFDMEDCMAYIPNTDSNQRQQEAGQPDVDQSNEPGYARLQRQSQHGGDPGMQHQSLHSSEPGYASLQRQSQYGSEPEYANIGVNRDPTRPHSILDDDGYEVIPI